MSSLRSENVHLHAASVDRSARVELLGQQPTLIWFTGLSGSGKSTVADLVASELHAQRRLTYMLDGDNVRHGLCGDLGFSEADRSENIRRVAAVAGLMLDAGLIVLASFISPFRADRDRVRAAFAAEEFFEIHVDVPLELAQQRDPKGLYAKALRGEIKNYTGVDSPYEAPEAPELRLDMATVAPEQAARRVLEVLTAAGRLEPEPVGRSLK